MSNIQEEIWKDIPEFKGYYQASNLGRIRRLNRRLGGIIKQTYNKRATYKYVCLCLGGKKMTRSVHTLVAKAFIPNPNNLPQVNHKDSNRLNNHASNFEWVTVSGNKIHSIRAGNGVTRGQFVVIDDETVKQIRFMNAAGKNQTEIASILSINQCTVSRVVNKKRQYAEL